MSSDPLGAEIHVDGRDSGKTTPSMLDLGGILGSDHEITIIKKGFEPERRKVTHYTRFDTIKLNDGVTDYQTFPFPLWFTFGDFFFPFEVRWAYVPHNLHVKLFPEGTFLKKKEDAPGATK